MRRSTLWQLAGMLLCISMGTARTWAQQPAGQPDRYPLTYPDALEFCPPVESYFDDVSTIVQKVGTRTVRHQPNGGYGLAVVAKLNGRNLLHLGADVAWQRVGSPVYATAAGVVRVSEGPPTGAVDGRQKSSSDKNRGAASKPMSWGNIIVLEHHLTDGSYVTSVYGHLSPNRLVAVGDVVEAGQMIGAIGKAGRENGGYKPHLHFGVRVGRMIEPGCTLLTVFHDGKSTPITVVDLNETEVELRTQRPLATLVNLQFEGRTFPITRRDGKLWLTAGALNYVRRADFPISGYGLSTDGWRDPTEFLMEMLNTFPRANFGDLPTGGGNNDPHAKESKRAAGSTAGRLDARSGTLAVVAANKGAKAKRPKLYNPRAKAKVLVDAARRRAAAAGKRVLIVYGGNWCEWCYRLHDVFNEDDAVRQCLKRRYEVVLVDIDSAANKKLAADYKADLSSQGLPYFTVLDGAGKVLINRVPSEFEEGATYDRAKILAFLEEYAIKEHEAP